MRRVGAILWGWVQESRTADECLAAGWAGSMALPRVLTLGADNRLRMDVLPEFASLRRQTQTVNNPQSAEKLKESFAKLSIQNRAGEVVYKFKPQTEACALELRTGSVETPLLSIQYNGASEKPALTIGEKTLALTPDGDGVSDRAPVDRWIGHRNICRQPRSADLAELHSFAGRYPTCLDGTSRSADEHQCFRCEADLR